MHRAAYYPQCIPAPDRSYLLLVAHYRSELCYVFITDCHAYGYYYLYCDSG
jgi:hypothetical protein